MNISESNFNHMSKWRGRLLFVDPRRPHQLQYLPQGEIVANAEGFIASVESLHGVSDLDSGLDLGSALMGGADASDECTFILPGFIDVHTHFPQIHMLGSYGHDLLRWLEMYTFPEESRFSDGGYASSAAQLFIKKLFEYGITAFWTYSSSHENATAEIFSQCYRSGHRAVIGKVSMDRLGPENLLAAPRQDLAALNRLAERWHNKDDRLFLAVTPRFAPACSGELLAALRDFYLAEPSLYVQTHFAETQDECALARNIHGLDYLEIYRKYSLIGPRTVLGHCLHLGKQDFVTLAESQTHVAHCPSSNLFLGSGIFPSRDFLQHNIAYSAASDIGAGISLSPWRTMHDAYCVHKLSGTTLSAADVLGLLTVKAASAFQKKPLTGTFSVGSYADLQILTVKPHSVLAKQLQRCKTAEDIFFRLLTYPEDFSVKECVIGGKSRFQRCD